MSKKDTTITTLTIRNIPTAVKKRLRIRAARHGRSMESELRSILSDALATDGTPELNLAESIRRRVAKFGGVDLEPHPPAYVGDPIMFDT